jgi:hypothetical protein
MTLKQTVGMYLCEAITNMECTNEYSLLCCRIATIGDMLNKKTAAKSTPSAKRGRSVVCHLIILAFFPLACIDSERNIQTTESGDGSEKHYDTHHQQNNFQYGRHRDRQRNND